METESVRRADEVMSALIIFSFLKKNGNVSKAKEREEQGDSVPLNMGFLKG